MRKIIGTAVVLGVVYYIYCDWKEKQTKAKTVTVKVN